MAQWMASTWRQPAPSVMFASSSPHRGLVARRTQANPEGHQLGADAKLKGSKNKCGVERPSAGSPRDDVYVSRDRSCLLDNLAGARRVEIKGDAKRRSQLRARAKPPARPSQGWPNRPDGLCRDPDDSGAHSPGLLAAKGRVRRSNDARCVQRL